MLKTSKSKPHGDICIQICDFGLSGQRVDQSFSHSFSISAIHSALKAGSFISKFGSTNTSIGVILLRRLIGLHPGAGLRHTHLLGSDVLPMATSLLPDDLEAWGEAARRSRVDLDFSIHVVRRDGRASLRPYVDAVRRFGVRMVVDRAAIGTPSSSAFRNEGAISLVLPNEAILSRTELLFRYGMSRSWSSGRSRSLSTVPETAWSPARSWLAIVSVAVSLPNAPGATLIVYARGHSVRSGL